MHRFTTQSQKATHSIKFQRFTFVTREFDILYLKIIAKTHIEASFPCVIAVTPSLNRQQKHLRRSIWKLNATKLAGHSQPPRHDSSFLAWFKREGRRTTHETCTHDRPSLRAKKKIMKMRCKCSFGVVSKNVRLFCPNKGGGITWRLESLRAVTGRALGVREVKSFAQTCVYEIWISMAEFCKADFCGWKLSFC